MHIAAPDSSATLSLLFWVLDSARPVIRFTVVPYIAPALLDFDPGIMSKYRESLFDSGE